MTALVAKVPADLATFVGLTAGPTPAVNITGEQLDEFHNACGGETNGNVDPYLALSLVNLFLPQLVSVSEFSMGVNVGLDGVNFFEMPQIETRITASAIVRAVDQVGQGTQVVVEVTLVNDDDGAPVLQAQTVSRFFP
jgi:hypothetical protein